MTILSFRSVTKKYADDAAALEQVSFEIAKGEFTALAGPSGSGKSTILNLAAGLDHPTAGSVFYRGKDLSRLSSDRLALIRRSSVGFVFQSYNLFPVLTALENVEYSLALTGMATDKRRAAAKSALEEVGLSEFEKRLPAQLSGGQQQRVAIARAIVILPTIVFADEPTANLDSSSAESLLLLFRRLNESKGITFLFSSHDPRVLRVAKRVLLIADGRVANDTAIQTGLSPLESRKLSDSVVRFEKKSAR
jgi:putative ABC transport system ATP-binding protein